ncbi:NAD-dependent epimerase/dehydratase family protein [Bradyrhizobium canariense]|uniref:NAD-dependent epimerase/dehydratase family protein n=1 Tax=Bradyrhizobium canariense TaxID=255045 RepID=UPI0014120327|nr:NAD-dependent epimerase/dehydratase family protein [Bradyrhizobium canariense]
MAQAVLITGSDGFVGQHLIKYLAGQGLTILAASRSSTNATHQRIRHIQVPDLASTFDWRPLLSQCDAVVHLAGVAHRRASERSYISVNIQGTASLAQAARDTGTKHFVFVSSIAAQCGSFSDQPQSEDSPPRPTNAYGRSKLEAEDAVRSSGVPHTILRPVVIYGLGEKGNFALLSKVARLPIPLPFGSLDAPRSVLSINNFNSAVDFVLTSPHTIGETIIVSDPNVVSVTGMIAAYRVALNRPPNLFSVPEKWIETALSSLGYRAAWNRMGAPLVATPNKLIRMGWKPVHSNFSPGVISIAA